MAWSYGYMYAIVVQQGQRVMQFSYIPILFFIFCLQVSTLD